MVTGVTIGIAEKRSTFRELFAVSAYRVVFVSRALAIAADTLRIIALSVLVYSLTRSALLSAVTFGIGFLPQVAGGLLFGSLADRIRPRRLITAGYLVECVAAVCLATLPLPVGISLGIVAAVGAFMPVFGGASSRLIAEVLPGDLYVLGRSASSMASGAAQLLGMAFGGLAVAVVGPQRALLVSAAAHAAAALIVRFGLSDLAVPARTDQQEGARTEQQQGARNDQRQGARTEQQQGARTEQQQSAGTEQRQSAGTEQRQGARNDQRRGAVAESWQTNRTLLGDGAIRSLLLIQWLPPLFIVGAEALIVAYADLRGFAAGSAGLLLACSPAGMLAGHLIVGRFLSPQTRTRMVAPLIVLLGAPVSVLAFSPPEWIVGAVLFLTGCGFAYPLGLQRVFIDAVPEHHRGQAFGLLSMGLMTFQGIGPLVFGLIAQGWGIRAAMGLAAAACVSTAAIRWRRER
jgi:MFS family permease